MQEWKRRFILITCGVLAVVCFAFVRWIRLGTTTVCGRVVSVQPCQYRAGNAPTGTLLAGSEVTIRSSDDGRLHHLGCSAQGFSACLSGPGAGQQTPGWGYLSRPPSEASRQRIAFENADLGHIRPTAVS